MSRIVLWLPKQLIFSHYVLLVNLTTSRKRMAESEQRISRMRQRLFADAKK